MNELFSKIVDTARETFPGVKVDVGISNYDWQKVTSYHIQLNGEEEKCDCCGKSARKLEQFTCGPDFETVLAEAKEKAQAAGIEVVEADNAD